MNQTFSIRQGDMVVSDVTGAIFIHTTSHKGECQTVVLMAEDRATMRTALDAAESVYAVWKSTE